MRAKRGGALPHRIVRHGIEKYGLGGGSPRAFGWILRYRQPHGRIDEPSDRVVTVDD